MYFYQNTDDKYVHLNLQLPTYNQENIYKGLDRQLNNQVKKKPKPVRKTKAHQFQRNKTRKHSSLKKMKQKFQANA